VDEVVGLAGFVTPGMRVDVLMSGIPPGGNPSEGSHVHTLLENIQVLSAGESLQKDSEGKPHPVQVVNLLVAPEQAEKLTLASSQTHIQLVLRNPLDMAMASPPGALMSELFGTSAARPTRTPGSTLNAQPRAKRIETARPAPQAPPAPARLPDIPARIQVVEVINGVTRTEVKFTVRENP
jgi:pilus assembly protein CpaB